MTRDVLTAASHAAIILCSLHREYLRDRGERCAANGMPDAPAHYSQGSEIPAWFKVPGSLFTV